MTHVASDLCYLWLCSTARVTRFEITTKEIVSKDDYLWEVYSMVTMAITQYNKKSRDQKALRHLGLSFVCPNNQTSAAIYPPGLLYQLHFMHPLSQLHVELLRFANDLSRSESWEGPFFLRAQALAIGRIGLTTIPYRSGRFSVNPCLKRIRSDPAVRFLHMDLPPMWQSSILDLPRYSNHDAATFQPQWLTLMMHGLCDPSDAVITQNVAESIASLVHNSAGVTFWFLAFNKDCVLHLDALVSVLSACLPRIQREGEMRCILQFTQLINNRADPNVRATDAHYPEWLGQALNGMPASHIRRLKFVIDFVEYHDENLLQFEDPFRTFKTELKKQMVDSRLGGEVEELQIQDWVDSNVRVEWRASAQEAVHKWLQFPAHQGMNLSVYWPYIDYDHLRAADTYPRTSTKEPRSRIVHPDPDHNYVDDATVINIRPAPGKWKRDFDKAEERHWTNLQKEWSLDRRSDWGLTPNPLNQIPQ